MASGQPLNDTDRAPWLAAIAGWIDDHRAAGTHGVVSCSALKRRYREVLIGTRPDVGLVYLKGGFALIADRMGRRKGHFMPPALLKSQFEALEEPFGDEAALVVSIRLPPKRVVERIVEGFALTPARVIPSEA
jgi:carbohydrate kinase (thermoresistant glucokinase family)